MPEVTDSFIWIPVKDAGLFVQDSFRQMTLSEDQGIHARIGKLKSDPEGGTVVQSYYFDKSKWSMEECKKWVADHKKSGSSGIERRCCEQAEFRLEFENRAPKIIGYAAVFNSETALWPGFFERVAPGAFAETIMHDDVRALWNHNSDYVLGRTSSGTLTLREDDKGLVYEVIPPDTTWAKDLMTLMKRKDISQSSFGFNIEDKKDLHDKTRNAIVRTLTKVRLFDVSPVTFAAYPQTEVNVRMTRFDGLYLVEDEVIEAPTAEPVVQPAREEDLMKRLAALKERNFGL